MTAAGPDAPEPQDDDEDLQVERVTLDDGRALLLFTWDDPA